MSRLWLIIGSVVTAVVLAGSTVSVLGALAHEKETETFSIPAEGIDRIDVDSHDGRVEIVAADTDTITVEAAVSHGLRRTRYSARTEGDTLVVRARCPRGLSTWCRVDYRITVPAEVAVQVTSRHGRVTVDGVGGDADLRTSNGPIEVSGLTGDVSMRTSNGAITARSIITSTVRARTSNGAVRLTFAAPPENVDIRTSNGPVEVVVPDDATTYRVDAATSSTGSTRSEVRTDPSSDRSIRARTSNGSITIRYPNEPQS